MANHNRKSQEKYLEECKAVHGEKYDYSKTVYNYALSKVTIICRVHGPFEQEAASHLKGYGCFKCKPSSRPLSQEAFLALCAKSWGDEYDYTNTVYKGMHHSRVEVRCRDHGVFHIFPADHIHSLMGCPLCPPKGGFDRSAPAYLYVLRSACESIVKVGVTGLDPAKRIRDLNQGSKKGFSLLKKYYFEAGLMAERAETALLRIFRQVYKNPLEHFAGYSECFVDVNLPSFLNRVTDVARSHKSVDGVI